LSVNFRRGGGWQVDVVREGASLRGKGGGKLDVGSAFRKIGRLTGGTGRSLWGKEHTEAGTGGRMGQEKGKSIEVQVNENLARAPGKKMW